MGAVVSGPAGTCRFLVGVGGIGSGEFWALSGDHTLGRNESRAGKILDRRDFCKLHIVAHYVAALAPDLRVMPVGRIGEDSAGASVVGDMRAVGMDVQFVATDPEAPTLFSVCFTYPDGDGGNITTDDSAASRVTAEDVERAVGSLDDPAGGIGLTVPEAPLPARAKLLELGRRHGWLNAASFTTGEIAEAAASGLFAHVGLLGVNRDEAAAIAGVDSAGDAAAIAKAAATKLAEVNPDIRLCVTAGAAGAFGWASGRMEHTPAPPIPPVNTAGAGDATLSALIVATAAGLPLIDPGRPPRTALTDAPLTTAMDLAALVSALAVASEDTINFAADPSAVGDIAAAIGADAAPLAAAMNWSRPG